ncbi:hypothetical protein D5018_19780 [Parashewanella curva]|uniref:Uncharacterized protein n=1 Tax=Parashewanella curva TaxID=2338552 RepID=A0A3L8PT25_9GAMM|nr:hypothetical protein [Parashewanella curva]RLV57969.1 hypothetical protein D5018_19780 [Parashewanella curva]
MRLAVKARLVFLVVAILGYGLGIKLLPEQLQNTQDWYSFYFISLMFFAVFPSVYWFCIIKLGEQKLWKMLVIFSLSSLVARYSFPPDFASYFEFISYIRYPLIALLIIIEVYLMVSIIRGLWQARGAKGDPRLTALKMIDKHGDGDADSKGDPTTVKDKLLKHADEGRKESTTTLALTLASEPASWYYAIPYFSKNHSPTIAHLNSRAAKVSSMFLLSVSLIVLAILSYSLLWTFSELLAVIICSLFLYGMVFCIANYRAAKNYSIYIQDEHLIITKGLIGIMRIPLEDIGIGIYMVCPKNELANSLNASISSMV